MSWNEDDSTFTRSDDPELVDCTPAEGESVVDGYEQTCSSTFTFVPATPDEKTPGGVAVGCEADDSTNGFLILVPTSALG